MRDPKRIPVFLDTLQALWEQHPDMRFFQLVAMVENKIDPDARMQFADFFYVEDDIAEKAIVALGVGAQDPRGKS